jgi:hypothetical protein
MSYFTDVIDQLRSKTPASPYDLLRFHALLVLTTGENTTVEDVHNAWSAWRAHLGPPDGPEIVPFDELTPGRRELDLKYRDIIRDVARKGKVS